MIALEKPAKNCQPHFRDDAKARKERKMAGLSREDLIGLSAKDLAVKLTEVGVPKSLTEALHGKCCILLYLFSLLLNITVLHGVLIFASLPAFTNSDGD